MVDKISPQRRSWNMSRIGGQDTAPELAVRQMLRGLGIAYRLHVRSLPGRPDIVIRKRHKIIEVRGCFWHRHPNCQYAYVPKSNQTFWKAKFRRTVERDAKNDEALRNSGWDVLVLWECETRNAKVIRNCLRSFLA